MVYLNNVNNSNTNISKISINRSPYIIIFLIGLLFFVVIYVVYYYFRTNQPLPGFTYYSGDILNIDPLFNTTAIDINDCIDTCNKQPNCDGITFNSKTKSCLGQYEGRLRSDSSEFTAWVKSKKNDSIARTGNVEDIKQSQSLVSLVKSQSSGIIPGNKIPVPVFLDQFTFSFWITVKDWYQNYSYWRHIFHKGSPFDKSPKNSFKKFEYRNWEEITDKLPEQCIGAWLTPFQNNVRIALTTTSPKNTAEVYPDANVEKCECIPNEITKEIHCSNCWITDMQNDIKYSKIKGVLNIDQEKVEYIDISDIQTNIPTNIIISVSGISAEIYVNGNFNRSIVLSGKPKWNSGDLYVHNPIGYNGELKDLIILPGTSSLKIIKDLYKNKNKNKNDDSNLFTKFG
jgi:hypothetical protein